MLTAYMDASGTHDGSHNCVIGGYWGSVNHWKRYERTWKTVLNSEDVHEFHANEFWPRLDGKPIGIYQDWSEERRSSFIDRLLNVIQGTKIYPFACGVLGEEWQKLPDTMREGLTGLEKGKFHKPLFLALKIVIFRTATNCHAGNTIHFVFDNDPSKSGINAAIAATFGDVMALLREEAPSVASRVGGLTFADSDKALPVQAADLLAYEAHRYAKAAKGNPNHPVRVEYLRAIMRMKAREDFLLFDETRFREIERMALALAASRQA